MNTKKLLILVMALAAVAGLYTLSERSAAKKERKTEVSLAEGFDAAKAAAISIKTPDNQTVLLRKQDGRWKVTSGEKTFNADNSSIASFLAQIGTMKSATVVSKNPQNFDAFEVSDAKAVEVKIEEADSRPGAHVLIGKNGPDIFSSYVRPRGSQTVYLVPGFLKNSADREMKDWRDKQILDVRADQVKLYSVSGETDLQIRKADASRWQALCNGRVLDAQTEKIMQVLKEFAGLAAADFSDNTTTEAKLDKPLHTITASLQDGTRRKLFLGADKNAFQQFVKTEEGPQIYVVEKAALDRLIVTCDELKGVPAADNATAVKK